MQLPLVAILASILTTSTVFAYPNINRNSALTARQVGSEVNLAARESSLLQEQEYKLDARSSIADASNNDQHALLARTDSEQHRRIASSHNEAADKHSRAGHKEASSAHSNAAGMHILAVEAHNKAGRTGSTSDQVAATAASQKANNASDKANTASNKAFKP